MTIAQQIADEHAWLPLDRCTCNAWAPRKGVGPRDFIEHIAEVTETATRAIVFKDIEAAADAGPRRPDEETLAHTMRLIRAEHYTNAASIALGTS